MSKIFVAGHTGLLGSEILAKLLKTNHKIIIVDKKKIDLRDQKKVLTFFEKKNFDELIICSAKVGGIYANTSYPADFIYDNLMIQNNLIYASHIYKLKKVIFFGSSCAYPKLAKNPIKESSILTGKLEPTNEFYAIAKICGIKMCEAFNMQYPKLTKFICITPCNLYGPNDKYNNINSHVIPSLLSKFHKAKNNSIKKIKIWGSGKARREFMHINDLVDATLFLRGLNNNVLTQNFLKKTCHLNVGSGSEVTIKKLASIIKKVTNFKGQIIFDKSKPDGMMKKLLDSSKINKLGWKARINLIDGIKETYNHYLLSLKK